jgi:hypothetical protein
MQGRDKWRRIKNLKLNTESLKVPRQPCIFAPGGSVSNFFSFLTVFLFFFEKMDVFKFIQI